MLVSIILPTFNRCEFLDCSISSILNQTYYNWELIVVDDGSFDETKLVVNKYLNDARIKYYYKKREGVSAARNFGIEKSNGKFITFLDSDDFYFPLKLEAQLNLINNSKNLPVISCGFQIFNQQNQCIGFKFPKSSKNIKQSLVKKSTGIFSRTPLLFIAKSHIEKNSIKFDSNLAAMEDWDFLFQLSDFVDYKVVNMGLVGIFDHNGPRVHNLESVYLAEIQLLKKYRKIFIRNPIAYFRWSKKVLSIYSKYNFHQHRDLMFESFPTYFEKLIISVYLFLYPLFTFYNNQWKRI